MADEAVMAWLVEKLHFGVVRSGSYYELVQRWEVGLWFHETWQAEQRIQRLNGESSYDGGASLVLQLK
jgi:hypothetical protein